jgi:2-hydroxy-3-oxopropionate reductase
MVENLVRPGHELHLASRSGVPEDLARMGGKACGTPGKAAQVRVRGNGDGQTTEVANQIIVALTIDAVAEAPVSASKAGADPAMVQRALMEGFADSRIPKMHNLRMIERQFAPGCRIELHQQDVALALQAAPRLALALPATNTAQ